MTETTSAAALVAGKEPLCSPSCLLASHREAISCGCPCGGKYHALLADTPVTLAPGHTRRAAVDATVGQLTLDLEAVA